MRLVIFDTDGTLTQTTKADEECFVRSLDAVCGFSDVDTDWSCNNNTATGSDTGTDGRPVGSVCHSCRYRFFHLRDIALPCAWLILPTEYCLTKTCSEPLADVRPPFTL